MTYAEEGATNPLQYFYAVNNTLVNDGSNGTFFRLTGSPVSAVVNNLMVGTGTAYSWTIKQDHNLLLDGCSMVDRAHYDYHLKASSGAIDAGRDPGFSGYHFNLTPSR